MGFYPVALAGGAALSNPVTTAQGGTGLTTARAAPVAATPADPVGNDTTSLEMMGLAVAVTPTSTGKVLAVITGTMRGVTVAEPVYSVAMYGTGTAPINGAAQTGTKFGVGVDSYFFTTSSSTSEGTPVAFQQILSLIPGTAYWFDMAIATSNIAGTATLAAVTVSLIELA
jgi:hypothetical protein